MNEYTEEQKQFPESFNKSKSAESQFVQVETEQKPAPDKTEEEDKMTQVEFLIKLAEPCELFHTADKQCFATIPIDEHDEQHKHYETWPISNRGNGAFREWLRYQFYLSFGKPPTSQALQDAIGIIEAKALFEGKEMQTFIRTAGIDNKIYIDLCNDKWEAVEITPAGWRVIPDPPVKFRRAKGMLPLPDPVHGGKIEELRPFLNAADDSTWTLLVAWLIAAMRPIGPYPVLLLQGEQGSAKSTDAKGLRQNIDPSTTALRSTPREERDLMIAANNSWILSFDNLTGVTGWLSDAICRLATGGGFATRTLYGDDEETIFNATRPVMLNGIDDLASRHDLLDRALVVNLQAISEDKRIDEALFWGDFEALRPRILGALLDAIAVGLKNINQVHLDKLPRMADFAKWVTACEPALPWAAGEFMKAYAGNREDAIELALEADPVAVAIRELLTDREDWEGTAAELLGALAPHVSDAIQRSKAWPKSAKGISNRIRRAATFLRQTGIEAEFYRATGSRSRRIRLRGESFDAIDAIDADTTQTHAAQGFNGASQSASQNNIASQSCFVATQPEPLQDKECVASVAKKPSKFVDREVLSL